MYRTFIAVSLLAISTNIFANPIWEDIGNVPYAVAKQLRESLSNSPTYIARSLLLDEATLRRTLSSTSANIEKKRVANAKSANRRTNKSKIFNLPLPDGSMLAVTATEYSIMEKSLSNRFPQFKSWQVQSANGKKIQGSINFTAIGFHAMLILENGDTIFIDPDKSTEAINQQLEQGKKRYNSFSKRKNKHLFEHKSPIKEIVIQQASNQAKKSRKPLARPANSLITYRLALAGTAEYAALNGETKESTLSAMYVTIDRINMIYKRDLAIQLELIDTDKLIYLNPQTDPYSNGDSYKMLEENIANLDAVIGNNNYDIGHLFGGDGTGGLALMSGVCRTDIDAHKAGGVTGSSSPYGPTFDIDYVAHEIGHQFGATHTFNSIKDSCSNNREASSAVEPGSGSTIMSYAGICAEDNLQTSSDAVFHAVSIEQINDYTRHSGEANCGVLSSTDNNNPTISTTRRHHIPTNTPFLLKANADDIDINIHGKDDVLTYTWDQIDVKGTAVEVGIDAGDNPLFRSYTPSPSNQRYFPQLTTLFGQLPMKGETMSLTNRELNFATSVRDGKGGIARSNTQIFTSGNTAFEVISQSNPSLYHINDDLEVRWNEASTSWAPINCNFVDIKLLTEKRIMQDLLLNTPNDGMQTISLSSNIQPITDARIMVACSDNIFFALSKGKIAIELTILESVQPIASVNSPTISEGDSGSKTLNYIISLTEATHQDATIQYTLHASNTQNPIQTGLVNILSGKNSAIISQVIQGNLIAEEDKSYQLTLFSPQNIQFPSQENLTTIGTVIDNDIIIPPVNVTINNIFVTEGDYDITKAIFTINLSHIATTHTQIDYATLSDSAQANNDFTAKRGTLSIPAGESSTTLTIDIKADKLVERDEVFWLLLSNPSDNTVLIDNTASATIINDDKEKEILADKEIEAEDRIEKDSAGGSFDGILTFLLIYLSLLRLRFKARKYRKAETAL